MHVVQFKVKRLSSCIMFTRCCHLLDEYVRAELSLVGEDLDAYHHLQDRFGESFEGLRQLSFIIGRMRELDARLQGVHTEDAIVLEMKVLTEAFYYKAFRVRTVLRMLPSPALRGFECEAIRDVRNHLLEHPEGRASGVITGGFAFGGGVGPALKHGRPTRMPEVFADSGLYANADQYRCSLEGVLEAAVANAADSGDRDRSF
jgi:hypothetical protein